jgi:hypothetical protein
MPMLLLVLSAAFADVVSPEAACAACPEGQEERSCARNACGELIDAGWTYSCETFDAVHYCRGPGASATEAGTLVRAGAAPSGWLCATTAWSPAAGVLLLAAAGIRRRRA